MNHQNQPYDALAVHMIDVKKGPDGYKIIEIGEAGCWQGLGIRDQLYFRLTTEEFNPKEKPVTIFTNKNPSREVQRKIQEKHNGKIRITGNLDSVKKSKREDRGKNPTTWENYNGIWINCANHFQKFYPDEFAGNMIANNPIFNKAGRSKVFAHYFLPKEIQPETFHFESLDEAMELAKQLEGKDLLLKPDRTACSQGIEYIEASTPREVFRHLHNFNVDAFLTDHRRHQPKIKRKVEERFYPSILQVRVPDVEITAQDGTKGYSVDRVGILMRCTNGVLQVEYLGGAHRIRTIDHPVARPTEVTKGLEPTEEIYRAMKPETLAEIVQDTHSGMMQFYHNLLQVPPTALNGKGNPGKVCRRYSPLNQNGY